MCALTREQNGYRVTSISIIVACIATVLPEFVDIDICDNPGRIVVFAVSVDMCPHHRGSRLSRRVAKQRDVFAFVHNFTLQRRNGCWDWNKPQKRFCLHILDTTCRFRAAISDLIKRQRENDLCFRLTVIFLHLAVVFLILASFLLLALAVWKWNHEVRQLKRNIQTKHWRQKRATLLAPSKRLASLLEECVSRD